MKNDRREENDTEKGDLTMITIENLIEEIKLPRNSFGQTLWLFIRRSGTEI